LLLLLEKPRSLDLDPTGEPALTLSADIGYKVANEEAGFEELRGADRSLGGGAMFAR
jgi:hypothetical protein